MSFQGSAFEDFVFSTFRPSNRIAEVIVRGLLNSKRL